VFLAAAADTRLEAAWHLLAHTWMRVGEVLALRWADLDVRDGRINIPNAVVGVPYAALALPPTGTGARHIDACADVMGALSRHHLRQLAERSEWGARYIDADLIVCREDGRPLHPRALHRAFGQRVAAAGLPAIALADLHRSRQSVARRDGVGP
jgi:integrase